MSRTVYVIKHPTLSDLFLAQDLETWTDNPEEFERCWEPTSAFDIASMVGGQVETLTDNPNRSKIPNMNEHTRTRIKEAVEVLKLAGKDAVQIGDYDSADRILTQLRSLETLTQEPAKVPNQDEITALELLQEFMTEAYNPDAEPSIFPRGNLFATSRVFDQIWVPKALDLISKRRQ